MNIIETKLPGLIIIEPKIYRDKRGYFLESYNQKTYAERGISMKFLQDNQSRSTRGVIRGLHYQLEPHAQTKLVRVLEGEIYDVVVDIRKNSPTFGQWFGLTLSMENQKQLLVPKGFAHGFSVLTEYATILYKCDNFYHPESEAGIIYNDKDLNIDWKINPEKALVSGKDLELPTFSNLNSNFVYQL